MGYRRKKVSAEENYGHWDDRQKATSDAQLAERLKKDEAQRASDSNAH
jgi:hypothetical protein